jgi:hypothetical protein
VARVANIYPTSHENVFQTTRSWSTVALAMRLSVLGPFAAVLPVFSLLGCADDPPIYPPIVVVNVGNVESGGSGNGNSGNGSGNRNGGGSQSNEGGGGSDQPDDVLYPHCDDAWLGDEPPVETACDLEALEAGGDLTGDLSADRTLESGHSYTLKGSTRVMPGVTLTIQPCVKVIGENKGAVLLVRAGESGNFQRSCTEADTKPGPGGKLVAVGEPMAPIVFTSAKPVGSRAPGDWGGLIINGNARNGVLKPGGKTRRIAEGLERSECYGWDTDEFNDESSGALKYVRIEYASKQLDKDNETNGLTFNAVGSGTEVSYVMVSNSADDCFEWFGGTVNADHLIALNCDDDMFDADEGYTGHVQFMFGRQYLTTTEINSYGMEISNGTSMTNPATTATFSNVTMCGGGPADIDNRRVALSDATSATPTINNALLTGFGGGGILVQSGGAPQLHNTWIWDNPIGNGIIFKTDSVPFLDVNGNSAEAPDRFCDCWAPLPQAVIATPIEGGTPVGVDSDATYVGAFADSSADSNWMRGLWVDFSDK